MCVYVCVVVAAVVVRFVGTERGRVCGITGRVDIVVELCKVENWLFLCACPPEEPCGRVNSDAMFRLAEVYRFHGIPQTMDRYQTMHMCSSMVMNSTVLSLFPFKNNCFMFDVCHNIIFCKKSLLSRVIAIDNTNNLILYTVFLRCYFTMKTYIFSILVITNVQSTESSYSADFLIYRPSTGFTVYIICNGLFHDTAKP